MAEWVSIASLVIWSTSAFRLPSRNEWRRWEYWWAFAVVSCGILGAFWSIVPVENASSLFTAIRTGPPLLLGALLALSAVKKGAYVSLSAAALIAVFVPMIAVSVATLDVGMILLAVVAVLPAVLAPSEGYSRESIVAGFTGAVPVALILIGVQVVAQPGIYIGQCRGDKCSVWGEALGPLGLGNALGVCLAVLGPLTMLVVPGVVRMLGAFLASAILVDLTSSRSALIGFAVAAFVAIVYRWQLRRIRRQSQTPRLASAISGARGVLLTGVALIAGVLILLPLYPWQAGAFTGRADLWSYALGSVIPSSPIFGHGSSFWVRQANTVELQANYATHNLLTEILVSGGLWGVLWLSVCVVAAMRSKNSHGGNLLGVAVVGIWLSSCLTEVSSAPGRLYLMASLFPLVLVIAQARDRSAPRLPSAGTPLEAQTTKVDIDNPTPAQ